MENKENPLAILPRVRRPLLSRLQENGLNPFVASVFVADAYGKAFELQVGYEKKSFGALAEEAWACKVESFPQLLNAIRKLLPNKGLTATSLPLDADKRAKLKHLADVVQNNLELQRAMAGKDLRKGVFVYSPKPSFEEEEFKVYEGSNPNTELLVWVKEYARDFLATGEKASQNRVITLRDGVALEKLGDHPNIVKYCHYRDESDEDAVYVFVERKSGAFLNKKSQSKMLSIDDKWSILRGILSGLVYLHQKGFVYRDLRPESVFITSMGTAKLFNFDCVRVPGAMTAMSTAAKRAARYRLYASYELLTASPSASGDVKSPSDIYQWAVIAYELLTGVLPYS